VLTQHHVLLLNGPVNIFKSFRKRHGLSQAELAAGLGLHSQSAVSNYENDLREPEIDVAKKFQKFAKKKGEKITLDQIYGVADV